MPWYSHHTYTPKYHSLLCSMREDAKIVVEIGIGNIPLMKPITGASLRMWRDYFPNAKIIGCDILEDVLFQEPPIHTFKVDQSSTSSLVDLINNVKLFGEYADFIIDDGSHIEQHQTISFNTLWPLLKKGCLYIIEDIYINNLERLSKLHEKFNFVDAQVELIYRGEHAWDNFIAYRKI
jgi:cephalosporin hydroxylase